MTGVLYYICIGGVYILKKIWWVILLLLVIVFIPTGMSWGMSWHWLAGFAGENSDWFSFWGGYLGAIITVAFAAYIAKTQSENAVSEHRKAELFVYKDKAKIDRIFEIQEDLAEIDIKCRYFFGMEVYQDVVDDKTVIARSIDKINGKIEEVNSKMERLQFYFREGEDGCEKCEEIIDLVNKGKEIVINKDEELSTKYVDDVRDVVKKYRKSYIDKQMGNMNKLLQIVNDSIQAK